ncbi:MULTISPECIES: hypothetical protein [Cyanophyceae]|nr:hypothetical protein [Trichocoleus sp. FACHB-832]MBD1904103.1 hypothetical protein [Trichocoleus sp. FACHB-832]
MSPSQQASSSSVVAQHLPAPASDLSTTLLQAVCSLMQMGIKLGLERYR